MKGLGRLVLCASLLGLTACSNDSNESVQSAPSPSAYMDYDNGMGGAMAGQMKTAELQIERAEKSAAMPPSPPPPDRPSNDNPSERSFLAYTYSYGFSIPAKSVASTANSHAQLCRDAGPQNCQLLGSNTNSVSSDYVNATLRLRAEPEWLKTFTSEIQKSVENAKGDMIQSNVSAQDLTRSILDTDARLKAQKTLRTRLENLLETRDAKLPDLLSLERELARVQGQIESATSTLNVLRKRVSMSEVNINYQTKQVAISGSTVGPIGRSFKNFFGTLAYGISNVIDFIAAVLPWMILVVPAGWFLRRWWRRRKIES